MMTTVFRGLRLVPFVAVWVLPGMAQAQLAPDWSASIPSSAPAPALTVDSGRNSILAATLSAQPVTVHKFGPTGAVVWQRSLAGAASRAFDVTTDTAGNIVLGGAVLDASGFPMGTLVAKLDAAGNLIWQDALTTVPAQVRELVMDAGGNVYALVQAGTSTMGPELQLHQYSSAGVHQWMRTFGATTASGTDSLVVNSAGQPVVAGNDSTGQAVVAAFDALGNPLWVNHTALPSLSLAAGRNGEVYAVGGSGGGFLAIRYGAAFNEVWRTALTTGGSAVRAMVDANGNLVMTGTYNLPAGGFGVASLTPNWRTVKLSPAGATLWSVDDGYATSAMGGPVALGLGIDGAVFVTGRSAEPVTDATGTVSFYRQSMATLQYSAAGVLVGKVYTSSSQSGTDLEVAGDGGVHVVGEPSLVNGTPAPLLHFAGPALAPAKPSALMVAGPVYESSTALATVTLSTAAGATVKLTSSNTSAARVPASVVVPAGATSANFTITTLAVRRNTTATIRASANGTTLGTTITVLNR